jgi:hypothetical protein
MATKKRSKKRTRRVSSEGIVFSFHGAFKKRADAERKARKVGGWFAGRFTKARGDYRYVVMGPASGVPF